MGTAVLTTVHRRSEHLRDIVRNAEVFHRR
jgi:hypothetical protein